MRNLIILFLNIKLEFTSVKLINYCYNVIAKSLLGREISQFLTKTGC